MPFVYRGLLERGGGMSARLRRAGEGEPGYPGAWLANLRRLQIFISSVSGLFLGQPCISFLASGNQACFLVLKNVSYTQHCLSHTQHSRKFAVDNVQFQSGAYEHAVKEAHVTQCMSPQVQMHTYLGTELAYHTQPMVFQEVQPSDGAKQSCGSALYVQANVIICSPCPVSVLHIQTRHPRCTSLALQVAAFLSGQQQNPIS
eukprot:1158599-Pelagomonas_calceolata.AAC.1